MIASLLLLAFTPLEEKVGSLFLAPLIVEWGENHMEDWEALLEEVPIGGALLYRGTKEEAEKKLERLGPFAIVAIDGEAGLGTRLEGCLSFPRQGTVEEIRKWACLTGQEARALGINLNLAPVADVGLATRSFLGPAETVSSLVATYVQSLQEEGVAATAKHFPGHGGASGDSHLLLPTLETPVFSPFQAAIEAGVIAIMPGHLLIPAFDPLPVTLSPFWIEEMLRGKMGFGAVVVTDALNMGALAAWGDAPFLAHQAGCDLLLYGAQFFWEPGGQETMSCLLRYEIPRAFRSLLSAYQDGRLPIEKLDQHLERLALIPSSCKAR